ncbi:MAG: hypothetical protein JWO12_746 [Frankiales bacterium]|nr:hypothetical protein [Frankiales bacterium]
MAGGLALATSLFALALSPSHADAAAGPAAVSAVGGLVSHTNQPSLAQENLAVSPTAVGHVLTLAVETKFPGTTSFTAAGVTGGGVSTWRRAAAFLTRDGSHGQELWWGPVTTAGSSTVTVTYTAGSTQGTSSSATSLDIQEFASTAGAATVWTLDRSGQIDTGVAATTLPYPTLSPSSTSELYVGYLALPGYASYGSTPGVVYQTDARGNQTTYATTVSSTITPTATASSQTYAAIAMLLQAR